MWILAVGDAGGAEVVNRETTAGASTISSTHRRHGLFITGAAGSGAAAGDPAGRSESDRSAHVPSNGPGASRAIATHQPARASTNGTSHIVAMVRRNPKTSWAVSAVPTYRWSARSLTIAESWAESATTDAPQARATTTTSQNGSPGMATTSAAVPETSMAATADRLLPTRSPTTPAMMLPGAPAAITANARIEGSRPDPWSSTASARNSAIQAHIA